MATHVSRLIWITIAIGLWAGKLSVSAQSADSYVREDSTHAYWKLTASYADQKPTVQFFSSHHELLYQERLSDLPGRMTRQTMRAFDIMLANLTSNRLLATTYLADSDLLALAGPEVVPAKAEALRHIEFDKGQAVFSIDPSVSQLGKLTISFAQQTQSSVSLSLEDEEQKLAYYSEFTNLPIYKRVIDLQKLPTGVYYVRVNSVKRKFLYRLTIDRLMNRYHLQQQQSIQ